MVACERQDTGSAPAAGDSWAAEPTIAASPIAGDRGQWKVVKSDYVTLTVKAPAAQRAKILYRPVAAGDEYVELKTFDAPSATAGEFAARVRLPADFAGDVWAEAYYPDGAEKDTNPISLARNTALADQAQPPSGNATEGPAPPDKTKPATPAPLDKSALSDEITRGKIQRASSQNGQPDIRIDVNVPAFQLCFWQNGKLINSYEIGVGRKDFPIDISNRKIWQIVFNPEWVPPDSPWVNKNPKVSPGEHIPASDSRNPLGKIKIPLGDGYLIHQAEKSKDIGHLVSHGCIRMQQADLIDLVQKIIAAASVPVPGEKIQHALDSEDRLVVSLRNPIPISIRYDTLVVQQGLLHVYPDIYGRGTNTAQNLRSDLSAVGVDTARIDDAALSRIVGHANKDQEYVISTSDIRLGADPAAGREQPLTSQSAPPPRLRSAPGGSARTTRHARPAPHHRRSVRGPGR